MVDYDPHAILDAIIDPAIVVDEGRRLVEANKLAYKTFPIANLGGDLALSMRHPSLLDAVATALAGEPATTTIMTFETPIFRVFEVHTKSLAVETPGKARILCLFRDITQWRRADRMRRDFVANVSHELRSPLSSLIGFIETLAGPAKDDPDAQSHFLKIMGREAERMARLVDDLLSLSRVEAGEHIPPSGAADISEIVRDIVSAIKPTATDKGMEISVNLPEDLTPAIGQKDELVQVFRNLLDNAVKYGKDGTSVVVEGVAQVRIPDVGDPGVKIAITNQGDTIDAMHIPRLTERFYRIDKGRSRDLGGTGLGLAIVKHIVNRHRGRLTIESDAQRGNCFTVYLPAQNP